MLIGVVLLVELEAGAGPEAETPAAAQPRAAGSALPPLQTLDGFGQLITPPLRAVPIPPDRFDSTVPSPEHPPGYYGPSGSARALNLITAETVLTPIGDIAGSSAVRVTLRYGYASGDRTTAAGAGTRSAWNVTASPIGSAACVALSNRDQAAR